MEETLIIQAAKLTVTKQIGSTSMLQRYLAVSYKTATKLIDELEELKIIGPSKGAGARDVYIKDFTELSKIIEI